MAEELQKENPNCISKGKPNGGYRAALGLGRGAEDTETKYVNEKAPISEQNRSDWRGKERVCKMLGDIIFLIFHP